MTMAQARRDMVAWTKMDDTAERNIETLGNLVYNIGNERFGIEEAITSRDTRKGNKKERDKD